MPKRAHITLAAVLIASAAVLGGCGAPHLRTVKAAKSQLVGQEAATLQSCIGEPLTIDRRNASSAEVWTYSSAQTRGAGGLRLAAPGALEAAHDRACVFTFSIEAGRIVAVESDNRAGWGFGSITKCSALVERCVRPSGT